MSGRSAPLDIRFPGDARYLPAIRELVRELLEAEGGETLAGDVPQILLAVQEACVNAIRHGHGGDASKPVELTVLDGPDRIEIRIRDGGAGFELPAEPGFSAGLGAESGRGLAIIQAVMDEVRVATEGGTTLLSLVKRKGAS